VSGSVYEYTNEVGGTRLFQAPEQAMSIAYGKPVDVWASGIIMYYMLSLGKHPICKKDYNVNIGKCLPLN
jgi:serine/threonine protein kinase